MSDHTRRTFTESIEAALATATAPTARTFAFGSLIATVAGLIPSCDPATAPIDAIEQGVIAYGQSDWVQLSGRRDTQDDQFVVQQSLFQRSHKLYSLRPSPAPLPAIHLILAECGCVAGS